MINKVFPVLALSIFASMLGIGIIIPLLPLYAEHLGASDLWIGIIFASFAISRAILMPFIGRLSDRRGRKAILSIGLIGSAIISLGYMSNSVIGLTIARLLHGVASGMVQPVAQAYIGDVSPKGEEGKWMGYFNAAFFTGFGFGPLMGGFLTDHFGTTSSFFAMGALNLLAFLIVAFLLPEIKKRKETSAPIPSFQEMGASNMMKGLFSFQLVFALGRGIFSTFLPIFAGISLGLSPSLIGILVAINILTMSLLQFYGGHIADRFNRSAIVVISSLVTAVSIALVPHGVNFWQLLVICTLGGISGAVATPAASALSVDEGRKFGMGSTMAILGMAFSIGMGIGPILGGAIADYTGVTPVFYLAAAIGVVGTILFSWFTRQSG